MTGGWPGIRPRSCMRMMGAVPCVGCGKGWEMRLGKEKPGASRGPRAGSELSVRAVRHPGWAAAERFLGSQVGGGDLWEAAV